MTYRDLLSKISRNTFYQMYIVENLSLKVIAEHFNITVPQLESVQYYYRLIKPTKNNYKIRKLLEEIDEATFVADRKILTSTEMKLKYGISAHLLQKLSLYYNCDLTSEDVQRLALRGISKQSFEDKQHNVEKCNNSKILHYGSLEQCYRVSSEKQRQTKLCRYGSATYNNRPKSIETCNKLYGANSSASCPQVIAKSKATRIKNAGSLKASYQTGRERQQNTLLCKYGVDTYLLHPECRNKIKHVKNSKVNNRVLDKILSLGFADVEQEFALGRKFYDFRLGEYLLEVNPVFTHNTTYSVHSSVGLDKYYHQNKSIVAQSYGFRCIHLWDWDVVEEVLNNIIQKKYSKTVVFEEPRMYIYNVKENKLTDEMTSDCCVLYDDGAVEMKE